MTSTYVGLHIPKCAGTSFLRSAQSGLLPHQLYQNTSIIQNWQKGQPEFFDIQDYSRLRLLWGHSIHEQMLHYVSSPVLFTGMRDPIERLVSEARYRVDLAAKQGHPFNMKDWLARVKNPMCWFIIHRFPILAERGNPFLTPFQRAKKVLETFDFVYFSENFNKGAEQILHNLGVKCEPVVANEGARKDIAVKIDESNLKLDIELYRWARSEFYDRRTNRNKYQNRNLKKFLSTKRDEAVLEDFLFASQAGEYKSWNVLDLALEEKMKQAIRALKEAKMKQVIRALKEAKVYRECLKKQ